MTVSWQKFTERGLSKVHLKKLKTRPNAYLGPYLSIISSKTQSSSWDSPCKTPTPIDASLAPELSIKKDLTLLSCSCILLSYPAPSEIRCTLTELPPFVQLFWTPHVGYRNERKCQCRIQFGNGMRKSGSEPECSGTGLRWWMPECPCRRDQHQCRCPAMIEYEGRYEIDTYCRVIADRECWNLGAWRW